MSDESIKKNIFLGKNMKDKIDCECGGKYILYNHSKHFKTDMHQKFINQSNDINIYKLKCKCDGIYNITAFNNHMKTKQHLKYMRQFFKNDSYFNEYKYLLNPNIEKDYNFLLKL